MENIIVTIPPQKFDESKYYSTVDCYMAEQLKKLGYKDITVTLFGSAWVSKRFYKPVAEFNEDILKDNFSKGIDTIVELVPYN